MDLEEQHRIAEEIKEFTSKKLRGKPFHALIAIETGEGTGLQLSFGTLTERSALQTWKMIVGGLADDVEKLLEKFNIRASISINKLIDHKG